MRFTIKTVLQLASDWVDTSNNIHKSYRKLEEDITAISAQRPDPPGIKFLSPSTSECDDDSTESGIQQATDPTIQKLTQWKPHWGSALPPPINGGESIPKNLLCPICFESEVMPSLMPANARTNGFNDQNKCSCRVCQGCLATWFVKNPKYPSCPVCLTELDRDILVEHLNMDPPIAPAAATTGTTTATNPTTTTSNEDDLTQEWFIENNIKQCPDCGIYIEKDGGCNHMNCDLCGYEFCWACLRDMSAEGCNYECEAWNEDEDDDDLGANNEEEAEED